ncbi:MAG: hypothetical protein WCL59_01955 [Cyanobium sp. ELA507]
MQAAAMADDTFPSTSDNPQQSRDAGRGPGRGPRDNRDNREPGGFRIRLSDNELQAARVLQEALGLRSTVAVLGFSLRTLAQQLEAGQLDELVAQQRALGGSRGAGGSGEGGGDRRPRRDDPRGGGAGGGGGGGSRPAKANPFARPSRPVAVVVSPSEPEPSQEEIGAEATAGEANTEPSDSGIGSAPSEETSEVLEQPSSEAPAPGDAGATAEPQA